MDIFRLENFYFAYPQARQWTLANISFSVPEGSFNLLCGPSAGGKSTLLRQLKPILTPKGSHKGDIYFYDKPLSALDAAEQSQRIGFVWQNVENQLVTNKVWHELAFGLESLNMDTAAIRRRVGEIADFFGISALFAKNVAELSGGQKQLLNLAAVMVTKPEVLILDEPTAMLDPLAAADFIAALAKLNAEYGTTIILAEQRLEDVLPLAHQVIVLEEGQIITQGTPEEAAEYLLQTKHPFSLSLPACSLIQRSVEKNTPLALTIRQGRLWLKDYAHLHPPASFTPPPYTPNKNIALQLKEVWFNYPQQEDVLKSFSLTLHQGEFLALLGANGSGKSTALSLIAGYLAHRRGKIALKGKAAMLPQNPQTLFSQNTVLKDLKADLPANTPEERLNEVINLCRLADLLDLHPYDLSGGQQQRLAFAKNLLLEPDFILLDEPTKGLDNAFKESFGHILKDLQAKGVSIIMASHDLSFCAQYADCCAFCFNGQIIDTAEVHEFFSTNSYLTTAVSRMCREYIPQVITVAEAVTALKGHLPSVKPSVLPSYSPPSPVADEPKQTKHSFTPKTYLSLLAVLILIPFTIFANLHWFNSQYYSFFALLILLECMLPFFIIFEGRKPYARELVIIALFCALGVAGRIAFFMLPQFKPVLAIVILAGAAFGKEYGFLIGSLTMLLSNMLLGMGPWVLWQMFATGLIGFLSGIVFKGIKPKRINLCLFGAFCAVFIYGGLLNPASAILSKQILTWPVLLSYYASGLPLDIIHAVATVFFLAILSQPLLEKIERLKSKYVIRQ